MFHKFKITTCAFILCLFGLTLMTVSPVFATDSAAFKQCQQIKPQGKFGPMKQKKNCFKDLARALSETSDEQEPSMDTLSDDHNKLCNSLLNGSKRINGRRRYDGGGDWEYIQGKCECVEVTTISGRVEGKC